MKIRNATSDEITCLMELERSCDTAAHWTPDQYRDLFQPERGSRRLVLVAETSEAKVVGFLVARHVASEWELENIVVSATERRKGIGLKLLTALIEAARQGDGHSIFLEVRASNEAARRFYERAGFEQTGRRKGYYRHPAEDALLYQFTLR